MYKSVSGPGTDLAKPLTRPKRGSVTAILAVSNEPFRAQIRDRLLEAGCDNVRVAEMPATLAGILQDYDEEVVVVGGAWPEPEPFLRVAASARAVAVVLLQSGGLEAERRALAMGARASLQSDISAASLEIALAAVNAGLIVLDRAVDPNRLSDDSPERSRPSIRPLSTREQQILSLVAGGTSNKGIARKLGVSANTVKFHLATVFRKLNAATRAEAVAEAIRRGDVSL
jgi:DNA-binding NarL/FixJ family response regulator